MGGGSGSASAGCGVVSPSSPNARVSISQTGYPLQARAAYAASSDGLSVENL